MRISQITWAMAAVSSSEPITPPCSAGSDDIADQMFGERHDEQRRAVAQFGA